MNAKFIKSNEKRDIIKELDKEFGIKEIPHLLIESGKERIRGFSGHLSKDEIVDLGRIVNIDSLGLYLIRKEHSFRLSFDATAILSKEISKNIIELSEENAKSWMRGKDIEIKMPRGTYVIKCKDYFLGCGKSNEIVILNHVPKDRRIRSKLQ